MATTWSRKQLEISALFHRQTEWKMGKSKGKVCTFSEFSQIVGIWKEDSGYFTIFAVLFVVDRRRTRFLIREQAHTHCGGGGWFEVHGYFLVWPVMLPNRTVVVLQGVGDSRGTGIPSKLAGCGHERLKICGIF